MNNRTRVPFQAHFLFGYFSTLLCLLVAGTVLAATPWSQYHGSAAHEGRWDGQVDPQTIALLWSTDLGLLRSTQVAVSADGQTLFAFAADPDQTYEEAGVIKAIDAQDGTVKWTSPKVKAYDVAFDWGSWSSPIYHDGYVYYAGSQYGDSSFSIYKIDAATGAMTEWSDFYGDIVNASLTLANGKLFISSRDAFTYDPSLTTHYAIDPTTGQTLWSRQDGGEGQGSLAYDSARNRVYQVIASNYVHYLRAYDADTGNVAWTADWSVANPYYGVSVVYDALTDAIYFQDYNFSGDGFVYKAQASDGDLIAWHATTESGNGAPAVDPLGNIYTFSQWALLSPPHRPGATSGFLTNGTSWTFLSAGGASGSPAWADGYIFTGSQVLEPQEDPNYNKFYLLNAATGNVALTLTGSGPASFGIDAFYTIGADGVLYAYSVPQPSGATLSGIIELQAYVGDITSVPVTIEIRNPGSTTALETHVVSLTSDGGYSLEIQLPGIYDIAAKGPTWLRQVQPAIDTAANPAVDFSLINGDCDGNNSIGFNDINIVIDSFGAIEGDAGWDPRADLDGNGSVGFDDINIVVNNFGYIGDE